MTSHVREQIKGLTDREAVGYLLELLEDRESVHADRIAYVKNRGKFPQIGKHGLTVLLQLWDHRGHILSMDRMQRRIELMYDVDYIPEERIRNHIKRLRRELKNMHWPINIECIHRHGYRLTNHDPDFTLAPERKNR